MSLENLQAQALQFLQQRMENPNLSEQEKTEIALKLLSIPTSSPVPIATPVVQKKNTVAESQNLSIPALYSLSETWQKWLVENKFRGVADQSLVEILKGQGLTEETANNVVFALPQEVTFAYLQPQWRSLQQQQLITEVYRDKEADINSPINRAATLTEDEFYQNYYQVSRPVIIENLGGDRHWHSLESLAQEYGTQAIDPQPYPNSAGKNAAAIGETPQTLGEYLSQTEPQVYVNFDLRELGNEVIAKLYESYPQLMSYLDCRDNLIEQLYLWLQSAYAPFPLQAKVEDSFVLQLWGESQWHLASPWQSEFLYGNENWVSPLDLDDVNIKRHPLCADAQLQQFTLQAGEALFIPALWWQQCRTRGHSAQVVCTNFKR